MYFQEGIWILIKLYIGIPRHKTIYAIKQYNLTKAFELLYYNYFLFLKIININNKTLDLLCDTFIDSYCLTYNKVICKNLNYINEVSYILNNKLNNELNNRIYFWSKMPRPLEKIFEKKCKNTLLYLQENEVDNFWKKIKSNYSKDELNILINKLKNCNCCKKHNIKYYDDAKLYIEYIFFKNIINNNINNLFYSNNICYHNCINRKCNCKCKILYSIFKFNNFTNI